MHECVDYVLTTTVSEEHKEFRKRKGKKIRFIKPEWIEVIMNANDISEIKSFHSFEIQKSTEKDETSHIKKEIDHGYWISYSEFNRFCDEVNIELHFPSNLEIKCKGKQTNLFFPKKENNQSYTTNVNWSLEEVVQRVTLKHSKNINEISNKCIYIIKEKGIKKDGNPVFRYEWVLENALKLRYPQKMKLIENKRYKTKKTNNEEKFLIYYNFYCAFETSIPNPKNRKICSKDCASIVSFSFSFSDYDMEDFEEIVTKKKKKNEIEFIVSWKHLNFGCVFDLSVSFLKSKFPKFFKDFIDPLENQALFCDQDIDTDRPAEIETDTNLFFNRNKRSLMVWPEEKFDYFFFIKILVHENDKIKSFELSEILKPSFTTNLFHTVTVDTPTKEYLNTILFAGMMQEWISTEPEGSDEILKFGFIKASSFRFLCISVNVRAITRRKFKELTKEKEFQIEIKIERNSKPHSYVEEFIVEQDTEFFKKKNSDAAFLELMKEISEQKETKKKKGKKRRRKKNKMKKSNNKNLQNTQETTKKKDDSSIPKKKHKKNKKRISNKKIQKGNKKEFLKQKKKEVIRNSSFTFPQLKERKKNRQYLIADLYYAYDIPREFSKKMKLVDFIFWKQFSLTYTNNIIEVHVDKKFKELLESTLPFGGKRFLFQGDIRQVSETERRIPNELETSKENRRISHNTIFESTRKISKIKLFRYYSNNI